MDGKAYPVLVAVAGEENIVANLVLVDVLKSAVAVGNIALF